MKKFAVLSLFAAVCVSGCVVRSYSVVKDRVDQEASGNQGYITGSAPAGEQAPKKFSKRATKVFEIEWRSPVKFERLKEPPRPIEEKSVPAQEYQPADMPGPEHPISEHQEAAISETQEQQFETYVVQKDDTLQKISAKFYGTTKRWMKIYEANSDKLKSPDAIRPGQEIKIPKE